MHESAHGNLYARLRAETFVLTWIAYAGFYLCRKNLSVVKSTLAGAEGLSNTQLGTIDTSYLVTYALGQFLSGLLCDRFGARLVVGIGLIATAIANVAFGFGDSLLFFAVAYGVNGFTQSTGWPGCAKTFARWFSRSERGTIMGLWCTCYQVGPIAATFLATWLLTRYGWRSAFFGPALVVAGLGVLFLGRQKASPEDVGLEEIEAYRGSKYRGSKSDDAETPADGGRFADALALLRNKVLWVLGLSYVVLKFIRYSFLFWLPFYMSSRLGYGAEEAGYTSLAFDLAGLGGAIFAGIASDRLFQSRRAPVAVVMMALLAVVTYLYASAGPWTRLENVLLIGAIGFFIYGPDSIASGVAAVDCGSAQSAATAAGFVNGLGSIGAALSGLLIGYVSDRYGWDTVLSLFAPLSILGALLLATLWTHKPREASTS